MSAISQAQTSVLSPAGEYYLKGVMETGSGFKLNEDHTFQFFFIYGALDRMGEGTWKMEGDSIIFNSRTKPAHDFALASSKQSSEDSITIHIPGSQQISQYLYCIIKGDGKQQEGVFGADEKVSFAAQPVESIELLFEFCPEKKSVFTNLDKAHNFFGFRFEPWFMEFFFDNFKLKLEKDSLNGAHPLLQGDSFVYKKAGQR